MLEKAASILRPNRECVLNTDLDGLLTGIILQNTLNWKVVGWYDSKKTLAISDQCRGSPSDLVFLDVFVVADNLECIDQHIVAQDEDHGKKLVQNPRKLNPNLENLRYASREGKDPRSYAWKYPFGTVHYIISLLEALGHNIEIDLNRPTQGPADAGDLILRADDAARTTSHKYAENASKWAWARSRRPMGQQRRCASSNLALR